jgi:hypothetical protein
MIMKQSFSFDDLRAILMIALALRISVARMTSDRASFRFSSSLKIR